MNESTNEPVEISTRMQEGEWTEESLSQLVGAYEEKLIEMGAPRNEIETSVQQLDNGAVDVHVGWLRNGVQTFSDTGRTETQEAQNARGDGEHIPAGEVTQDSKGLGAVLGDAERSAIDEPATPRSEQAKKDQPPADFVVFTTEEGKSYVEDAGDAKA
ncbi:hypothetical protein AAFM46_09855 [Arthrobacter sp. TMP15]|uniref:hypothetical protein n=1 Tax=Arthrobacter sp. TMP15 TaxID=3140789 RepID=UPI0031BB7B18